MIVDPVLARIAAAGVLDDEHLARLSLDAHFEEMRKAVAFMSLPAQGRAMMVGAMRELQRRRTVTLADGTVGYYTRSGRTDDCFAACIATWLQVPLEEVPDPRLDARLQAGESVEDINRSAWQTLCDWLAARGHRLVAHEPPPWDSPRWLGIVRFPGLFNDHTLVMSGREVLFDPVDRSQYERPVRRYAAEDVSSGFTLASITPTPVEER